jgi:G3E family GTPase
MAGRPDGKLPAAVLTGFLGSGKTSLLNRLVRDPAMARALVVINELGDIGLDHELVERSAGDILMLQSGCLCCTMRSDLVETLDQALRKSKAGEIASFDRVVVETTGLADPEPILQAFLTDRTLARQFDLRSITTTVDAVVGADTLDRHLEAVKQVAVADRLLITKTDIAEAANLDRLEHRLRNLNGSATITRSDLAILPDQALLWDSRFNALAHAAGEETDEERDHCHAHGVAGCTDTNCTSDGTPQSLHDGHVRTYSYVRDAPLSPDVLDAWLTSFIDQQGPSLLRFKAIVDVAGLPGPLALHGVQHVLHPPQALKAWPSADHRTRMVFITLGMSEDTFRAAIEMLDGN